MESSQHFCFIIYFKNWGRDLSQAGSNSQSSWLGLLECWDYQRVSLVMCHTWRNYSLLTTCPDLTGLLECPNQCRSKPVLTTSSLLLRRWASQPRGCSATFARHTTSVPQFHPDTTGHLRFSAKPSFCPKASPSFSTPLLQYSLICLGFPIDLAVFPSALALTQIGSEEKLPQLSALCKGHPGHLCGLIQPHPWLSCRSSAVTRCPHARPHV